MAEAVGTIPSVLTLLNYTVKTLNLVSKLRDVSPAVRSLVVQTEQLERVIKAIQSNDALDPNGDPLNAILQSCTGDLSTFQTRFQKLARGIDGGAIRKSWRPVVAVVQEKEFQQATRKIEAYKSTLQLHLQNQNLFATALALKVGRSRLM